MIKPKSPDFYHQVEAFIINSVAADISEERELNNEIGLFLLTLLHCHKEKEAGC
ncbi:hypothetical protein L3V77_10615 [Vibrio sp. DW001]|uniref:hypothetical protein n=1 Tax=Vibrio sp. DW001 TaxID=2912315 RepID=UPI0023B1D04E|nr:hypothetical protein [Vibrio sp. DW001]WED25519.1 hypothetical protein L3V77_10615 [Vibrio sp. DW001]